VTGRRAPTRTDPKKFRIWEKGGVQILKETTLVKKKGGTEVLERGRNDKEGKREKKKSQSKRGIAGGVL